MAQSSNVPPNHFVPFIDAVDMNVVWGMVADPSSQLNPVQLFVKTSNGGQTWTCDTISNAAGLCPSGICAISADTAWVSMFHPSGGQGKILRTNDGGQNWIHQSTALFSDTGNFPDWVFFWDGYHGICLGDPTLGFFEIYTTADGGNNWVRTTDGNIAPELTGEFAVTDVFATQGDSAVFFGTNQGRIYKSTDRGLHWTVSQTPFTDYIGAIAFRDANNGLATSGGLTGSTDVARTTDGGITWTLAGSNTGMSLKLGLCYLPGSDSTYFTTSSASGSINGSAFSPNDGKSWKQEDLIIHTDIDFVNDSTGWTGSNEFNAPMYKWSSPISIPSADAASIGIEVPANTGLFTQSPVAVFSNAGLFQQSFNVTMIISGGYSSIKTVNNLLFNQQQQVVFDPWIPAATGIYTIKIYTQLSGDMDVTNDTLVMDVTVFPTFENYGWTQFASIPNPTFGCAGAFHLDGNTSASTGRLFYLGGSDFTVIQPNLQFFETNTGTWAGSQPMPTAKYQFSAHAVDGKIYCSGGYSAGFTPDGNTYIYDIAGNAWSIGASMPTPAGDYASGVYRDSLVYYIGGFDGNADRDLVQVYNTYSNTWFTATPKPGTYTSGLRGGIYDNSIIVTGGFSQLLGSTVQEAYQGIIDTANPTQITWTQLPDYPGGMVSRLAAGVTFRGLKPLVLFTGGDPTGGGVVAGKECWGYDLQAGIWKIGRPKSFAVNNVSDFAALVYHDSLWMASVGGYDGSDLSAYNEWINLGASPPLNTGLQESYSPKVAVQVWPNPAQNRVFISFTLPASEYVSLEAYDVYGRKIRTIYSGVALKGFHQIEWDISGYKGVRLEAGVYILRLLMNEKKIAAQWATVKLNVIK